MQRTAANETYEAPLHEVVMARQVPGFYVVDAAMDVLAAVPAAEDVASGLVVDEATVRLSPVLAGVVRDTIRSWGDLTTDRADVALVADRCVVHVRTTVFAEKPSVALIVKHVRGRRSLERAVATFGFTSRETDVLALLLDGSGTAEIAHTLDIARPTVLQHVASLLLKTGSHRRSDLIAIVLKA
jgi:DNA-binding CsgD family transcriptional regulator